jgi:predicted dehydrogenase
MNHTTSIALIGAGVIGRTHVNRIGLSDKLKLAAIADPTEAGKAFAASVGAPWFADHQSMLDAVKPQGAIVATPNQTHVAFAIDCLERGVAALVEKPVADDVGDARKLAAAVERLKVPVLVGHHRRHNPINRRAREIVQSGRLGQLVNVNAMASMYKPDSYYDALWRRAPGGGPILINLIHDIDMLRFIAGEIVEVQAFTSNKVRGFEIEDSAAAVLKFANGALGTVVVSDSAAGPFCWDFCANEQDQYPRQEVQSHFFMGTHGSMSLPSLEVFSYKGERHWHKEMALEKTFVHKQDAYTLQLEHFKAVIEGREEPLCSAADGVGTLAATLAVRDAARSGKSQRLV